MTEAKFFEYLERLHFWVMSGGTTHAKRKAIWEGGTLDDKCERERHFRFRIYPEKALLGS